MGGIQIGFHGSAECADIKCSCKVTVSCLFRGASGYSNIRWGVLQDPCHSIYPRTEARISKARPACASQSQRPLDLGSNRRELGKHMLVCMTGRMPYSGCSRMVTRSLEIWWRLVCACQVGRAGRGGTWGGGRTALSRSRCGTYLLNLGILQLAVLAASGEMNHAHCTSQTSTSGSDKPHWWKLRLNTCNLVHCLHSSRPGGPGSFS